MKRLFCTISILIIIFGLLTSFNSLKNQTKKKKFTVVLDAGHGGKDPGKVAKQGKKRYFEKDIALNIVLLVGKELEKNEDINVVYTRKDDTFVDLYVRGKIANEAGADLFVSIHCNAHSSQAYGSETYVLGLHANEQNFEVAKSENESIYFEEDYETNYADYNLDSPESVIGLTITQEEFLLQSVQLAARIQQNFENKLKRKSRGVKQAGFIVLHQTFMPSVLVETGFITNDAERRYLQSSKGQSEISKGIANAIVDYRETLLENVGDDFSFETQLDSIAETPEVTEGTNGTGTETSKENKTETAVKKEEKKDVVFRVQIAAGSVLLEAKPYNFKGLDPVIAEESDGVYRYFYGESPSFEEVKKFQKEAREKGYPSAFIVAYKNGQKISVREAVKSTSN
ncbi:N-acetylmuramoyl-L-alanine amidase [Leptobacterium flavescens]|uniref:N-acetylmuramoyl-L-alanine amidase n=1 Tax=Leptobacterium flavescens TaxID=472055 RepID=A0A6P0UL57_9FLAO|nr:N-acetylmuramoyl-L-alanine amidase [Leptobacterium flavescens]NER14005.1 N-acetylmuramoyl-L-alanine amidase [Leptobacterium flavescens]